MESAFGRSPWNPDPEALDPLAEALEAWTQRAILAFLGVLGDSGADLWLVHDRAVVFGEGALALGPWEDSWQQQLCSSGPTLEVSDALAGVEVSPALLCGGLGLVRSERWLWPVAPGQRHLVEGLVLGRR